MDLSRYHSFFFVGIAGMGMSAIAQYLRGCGMYVSGSDRLFAQQGKSLLQKQFEEQGICCYVQDGSGIDTNVDVVVVSTAIEESNVEYCKAMQMNIPIIRRSELLAELSNSCKTIAIGGTSGKSTTTAMIFHIMQRCGKSPSLITGAGLSALQRKGLPGNAWNGQSDWLVIEADESDGSIIHYKPEVALLLNVARDHKDYDELMGLFATFKKNARRRFIVNADDKMALTLSENRDYDFGTNENAGVCGCNFKQNGFEITFTVAGEICRVPLIGRHNMENALAAIAASKAVGISLSDAVAALSDFEGIYRRMQLTGCCAVKRYVIDDFAHNPSEVAAAIKACQSLSKRVVAYFQPHGFGPLRFMHVELAAQVNAVLREHDVFLIGDVYYAGGTVDRNISPDIVSKALQRDGKTAFFVGNKDQALKCIEQYVADDTTLLVMGARDPHLDEFAAKAFDAFSK